MILPHPKTFVIVVVAFVIAGIIAIWLPGVVAAQQSPRQGLTDFDKDWRLGANEKATFDIDERLKKTENVTAQIPGIADVVHRNEKEIQNLKETADQLRKVAAVLDFIKWEATACAAGFGGFLWWVVNWIVKSFRQMRHEIVLARRDARIARNDDFQMIGIPLVKLLEKDHPELANALQERMYKRQSQEDGRGSDEDSGAFPAFRADR